jgi:hypothetical protein
MRKEMPMDMFKWNHGQEGTSIDATIRSEFPILNRSTPDGRPLVYLDSAASSQKLIAVIEALDDYYRRHNANIHRGVYQLSEQATARYEEARRRVAASVLCEMVTGMPLERAKALREAELLAELGCPIGPARLTCSLLSLNVLRIGLGGG